MHRCLSISEVVILISQQLSDAALISFGMTCRTTYEPAMDVRWTVVPSLMPLIRTFPQDACTIEGDRFSITRPLSLADWTRFVQYSRRVKRLSVLGQPENEEGMKSLYIYKPATTPFPILRQLTLNWRFDQRGLSGYARIFYGPRLDNAIISTSHPADSVEITYSLSDMCPMLSTYSLSLPVSKLVISSDIGVALTVPITGFCNLRSFSCSNALRLPDYELIASFPMLEIVNLKVSVGAIQAMVHVQGYFPALKSLCFHVESLLHPIVEQFFTSLLDSKLEVAIISGRGPSQAANRGFHGLLLALSRHQHLKTLKLLATSSKDMVGYVKFQDIQSLLSLRQLKFFHMENIPTAYDDAGLALITQAWPPLKSLDLYTDNPQATSLGVLQLLKQCPKVQYLGIGMNNNLPAIDDMRPGKGMVRPHFKTWNLYCQSLDNPETLASLLSDVTPSAQI